MRSYPTCQDSRRPALGFRLVLASHAGTGARVGENINVITGSESQFTVSRPRAKKSATSVSTFRGTLEGIPLRADSRAASRALLSPRESFLTAR